MTQLDQGAGLDRAAGSDDAHAIAESFHLRQDVARQQNGAPGLLGLADGVLEDRLHQRVEPRGRLVEDQQLDIGRQRRHERHLLSVALRVRPALLARVELEPLDQGGPPALDEPATQPTEQVDDLSTRQVGPQRDVTGDVGESSVQCCRLGPGVATEQPRVTAVRAQQPEEDPDRGRLPRAVRPEEPVHLTGGDRQVESVEGQRGSEAFGESGDLDSAFHELNVH